MAAVLVLRSIDNPGASDVGANYKPGAWRQGEVVMIREDTTAWGFKEMPLVAWGDRTVAQINAADPANVPLYGTTRVTDSGIITIGSKGDLAVGAGEVLVWQYNPETTGYFVSYGNRTDLTPGDFYHVRVSDKTVDEVYAYLEKYNKKLSYSSDLFDPATDNRRFTTTNDRVSVSGNNGFTEEGITNAVSAWNSEHPENTVVVNDTDNLTFFQCDGIMPVELFDEWKENTQNEALADYYSRKRWYFTQAAIDSLAAQNGYISNTASEIDPFLRDGLLD